MLEASIVSKIIEQGFIVLGIVIALVIVYLFTRYLKEREDYQREREEQQRKITEEVTTAILQSSVAMKDLSRVIEANLVRLDEVSTKGDVSAAEDRLVDLHKITHDKLDKISKGD